MSEYARPEFLADGDWLEAHLGDPNVRVVDCDVRDAYRRAHIPGAVCPADNYFKNPDDRRFIMTPDQFAAEMRRLGIGDETLVVAYDANGSLTAGRLWWCLNYYGHENVKVLNGGWNLWLKEERPITAAEPKVEAGPFTPRVNDSHVATADYVLAQLGKPDVVILDVRSDGEWEGTNTRGNKRQGHMPGAVHLEWLNNVEADDVKCFKSPDELRQMFEAAGITPEKEIITV